MKKHPGTRINTLLIILGMVIAFPLIGFGQDHKGHKMKPIMDETSDAKILGAYAKIQKAQASDSVEGVSMVAMELAHMTHKNLPDVSKSAETLAHTETLDAARLAFAPLSQSLIASIKEGKIDGKGFNEAYCPMTAAPWIQAGADLKNPYYGSAMLNCGMIRETYGESKMEMPVGENTMKQEHSH